MFVTRFNQLPSIAVIIQIDVSKAYKLITEQLREQVIQIHQFNMFDHNEQKCYFTVTLFELSNNRIIELGSDYAEVLYTAAQYDWMAMLLKDLSACKAEIEITETKTAQVIGFARAAEMN